MVSVRLPEPSLLSSRVALSLGAVASVAVAYKLLTATASCPPSDSHPPRRAPSSHWLLGDLPALLQNMTRFNDWILETTRACGNEPWLQSAPVVPDMVIVANPGIVEDIMRTQADVFGKGDFTRDLLFEMIGDSFFSLDGPPWAHQRKIAAKFFSAKMYRDIASPIIHAHVERALAKLEHAAQCEQEINVTALITAFTLQSFAELGFGLDSERVDPTPLDHAMDLAFDHVFRRVQTPKWLWRLQRFLNVGSERDFRDITTRIRDYVSTLVRESLEQSAGRDPSTAATMVELFINSMRQGEQEFSADLLCDLAIMFVIAGRDTTADTLTWFFYNLSKNPAIERGIRDELQKHVPELMDGKITSLTMEQTQPLVLLEATIKETLRLFPVVTLTPRQALRDTVLVDGTFIPEGTSLGISSYAMGRLTSVWGDDAAEFRPQRFLDPKTGKLVAVSPFKFFGFGAGSRNCIGMNLAMLEMKILIASIFSRFHLTFAPNDGAFRFSANLTMAQPLLARVKATART